MSEPSLTSTPEKHTWTCQVPLSDALRVKVHDGNLLIIGDNNKTLHTVSLPEDAYTNDMHAQYKRGTLTVTCVRKNPKSPAMQEKQMFDPDRPHPREIPFTVVGAPPASPTKPDPTGRGAPTPSQVEAASGWAELRKQPHVAAVMPAGDAADSPVTAIPVLVNPGGAVEAPDNGETIETAAEAPERAKLHVPHPDQVREQLSCMKVAPPGTTLVGRGDQPDQQAKHQAKVQQKAQVQGGEVGVSRSKQAAAAAPAGPGELIEEHEGGRQAQLVHQQEGEEQEEYQEYYEGQEYDDAGEYYYEEDYEEGEEYEAGRQGGYDRKAVDFTEEKVGMATRPYEARDFYVDSKASNDKVHTTIDISNDVGDLYKGSEPYDLTPQQTKRYGRPRIILRNKANFKGNVTGPATRINPQSGRPHAQPKNVVHRARIAFRVPTFNPVGNVNIGERVPPTTVADKIVGANPGGREIPMAMLNDHRNTKELATHFMG